jgi:hypothetical protein
MPKPPVRIHAGNNGVYDAVQRDGAWWIRFQTYQGYASLAGDFFDRTGEPEFSTTSYESAHEAMLAFERGPISYRANEVVA